MADERDEPPAGEAARSSHRERPCEDDPTRDVGNPQVYRSVSRPLCSKSRERLQTDKPQSARRRNEDTEEARTRSGVHIRTFVRDLAASARRDTKTFRDNMWTACPALCALCAAKGAEASGEGGCVLCGLCG